MTLKKSSKTLERRVRQKDLLSAVTNRSWCVNLVIRRVCDRDGNVLGFVNERHDGSPRGIMAAATRARDRMFNEYVDASNIQSLAGGTDSKGQLRWSIAPNLQSLAEVGTEDAEYIWTARTRERM